MLYTHSLILIICHSPKAKVLSDVLLFPYTCSSARHHDGQLLLMMFNSLQILSVSQKTALITETECAMRKRLDRVGTIAALLLYCREMLSLCEVTSSGQKERLPQNFCIVNQGL